MIAILAGITPSPEWRLADPTSCNDGQQLIAPLATLVTKTSDVTRPHRTLGP